MTESIGDIPISGFSEIQLQSGSEVQEIDLVGENTNLVLTGSDLGNDIEIQAFLVEQLSPDSIEKQRDNVKELSTREPTQNDFVFDELRGFISVSDIDVSESSDVSTYREVSISGKYLPWPKHYTGTEPISREFLYSVIDNSLFLEGSLDVELPGIDALSSHVILTTAVEGKVSLLGGLSSSVLYSAVLSPGLSSESNITTISADMNSSLSMSGEGGFGRYFGRHFSTQKPELEVGAGTAYGSGTYGSGDYGG